MILLLLLSYDIIIIIIIIWRPIIIETILLSYDIQVPMEKGYKYVRTGGK
jgi:hypothetical protein